MPLTPRQDCKIPSITITITITIKTININSWVCFVASSALVGHMGFVDITVFRTIATHTIPKRITITIIIKNTIQ